MDNPYTAVATFYDHLMQHVDYAGWADYIDLLFEECGDGTRTVLDA